MSVVPHMLKREKGTSEEMFNGIKGGKSNSWFHE